MKLDVQREPLRDVICRRLAEAIVTGELAPNERITLIATAERMGVSMTPLREALVQLEADGLVSGDPGRGYSVSPLTREELEEIYPFMGGLEALVVELGPPNSEDLGVLEEINRRLGATADEREAFELDRAWHRRLVARCSNRALLDALANVRKRAARYEVASIPEFFANVEQSTEHHRRVVAALRAADSAQAGRVLRENWGITLDLLIPKLPAPGDPPPSKTS